MQPMGVGQVVAEKWGGGVSHPKSGASPIDVHSQNLCMGGGVNGPLRLGGGGGGRNVGLGGGSKRN